MARKNGGEETMVGRLNSADMGTVVSTEQQAERIRVAAQLLRASNPSEFLSTVRDAIADKSLSEGLRKKLLNDAKVIRQIEGVVAGDISGDLEEMVKTLQYVEGAQVLETMLGIPEKRRARLGAVADIERVSLGADEPEDARREDTLNVRGMDSEKGEGRSWLPARLRNIFGRGKPE